MTGSGHVRVRPDAARGKDVIERSDGDIIAVRQQQRDDLVRMHVQPPPDELQISLEAAGVLEETGRVAEAEGAEDVAVGLGLEEADAGVELGEDSDVLVVGR